MSNRTYLCCSKQNLLYPSATQKRFIVSKQILAASAWHVPIFWLALFRERDLRTEAIADGEESLVCAPACDREQALSQLEMTLPSMKQNFSPMVDIEGLANQFLDYLRGVRYPFITVEWAEIDALHPPEVFHDLARLALRGFEHPDGIAYQGQDTPAIDPLTQQPFVLPGIQANSHREVLLTLAGIQESELGISGGKRPKKKRNAEEQAVMTYKFLGSSWFQPVPWE